MPLDEIKDKYKDVAELSVYDGKSSIHVSSIVVKKDLRNQGIGTKIMNEIIAYADSVQKPVSLSPSKDLGGKIGKLKEFYKDLGFVPNKGRHKDFRISDSMIKPVNESVSKFLHNICENEVLRSTILEGFKACFESVSAFDVSNIHYPMFTSPIGSQALGSPENIFKTVPQAMIGGSDEATARNDYKYGPADANPTRDIKEETIEKFGKPVKIPKLSIEKNPYVTKLIKNAQPHIPRNGTVGKDFAREYNNYANPAFDKDMQYDTKFL